MGTLVGFRVCQRAVVESLLTLENHHPLPQFSNQILLESIDLNPSFLRTYRSRLVSRVGEDDSEVIELDKRCRRSGDEWMPTFG